jgi:hypothetical protein
MSLDLQNSQSLELLDHLSHNSTIQTWKKIWKLYDSMKDESIQCTGSSHAGNMKCHLHLLTHRTIPPNAELLLLSCSIVQPKFEWICKKTSQT